MKAFKFGTPGNTKPQPGEIWQGELTQYHYFILNSGLAISLEGENKLEVFEMQDTSLYRKVSGSSIVIFTE